MAKKWNWTWKGLVNLLGFVAIVCIGLALLIGRIGGGQLAASLESIAKIIAYLLTAISAFFFAHSRGHWAYYTIWLVCVVLIVVLMIL